MKSNQKFTLVLVAIAAALGSYMFFVESKKELKSDTTDVEIWSLSEAQASDLKQLKVVVGSTTATFKRDGDKWTYLENPKREVDTTKFDTGYKILRDLAAQRKLEEKLTDKAKYGLDAPSGSVTWGDEKTPYKLTFGATNPTSDGVYVHVAKDDGVYAVAKYKVDELKNMALVLPLLPEPTPTPKPTPSPTPSPVPTASAAASTTPASPVASAAASATPSAAASGKASPAASTPASPVASAAASATPSAAASVKASPAASTTP